MLVLPLQDTRRCPLRTAKIGNGRGGTAMRGEETIIAMRPDQVIGTESEAGVPDGIASVAVPQCPTQYYCQQHLSRVNCDSVCYACHCPFAASSSASCRLISSSILALSRSRARSAANTLSSSSCVGMVACVFAAGDFTLS